MCISEVILGLNIIISVRSFPKVGKDFASSQIQEKDPGLLVPGLFRYRFVIKSLSNCYINRPLHHQQQDKYLPLQDQSHFYPLLDDQH